MAKQMCLWCNKEFEPRKRWQQFCSARCRNAYHGMDREIEARLQICFPEGVSYEDENINPADSLSEKGAFFIAENCTVVGDVSIGKGSSIWFGAVIRGDLAKITIGEYTNIQDLCVLHCDPDEPLTIGNYVTVGHGAVIHCKSVGDKSLIGIGAILLGGAEIGEGCIIGAGALIRENAVVPPYSIVAGVPGKIIGKVDKEKVDENVDSAKRYYENALKYLRK